VTLGILKEKKEFCISCHYSCLTCSDDRDTSCL